MPVKNRRNGLSRKQANPIVYSNSLGSQLSDTPTTSAASSPPDRIPGFTPEPPLSEAAQDAVPETTTESVDSMHLPLEYMRDAFHLSRELDHPPDPIVLSPRRPIAEEEPPLVDISEPEVQGHVRSPLLAREPSTLESFSRTIRGYVPSSIPIPSVVPTPPRVSRPVSFGSFLPPSRTSSSSTHMRGYNAGSTNYKHQGGDGRSEHEHHRGLLGWENERKGVEEMDEAVFDLDEEAHANTGTKLNPTTRYPSLDKGEEIISASWGKLVEGARSRRVLMLGYQTGLQIWDCSSLGSVSEVLNLAGPEWGAVEMIEVLPDPRPSASDDAFASHRPLIGILAKSEDRSLLVYSLRTHEVIRKLSIPHLVSFSASSEFLALSTSHPATLHILSSRTLQTLHILQSDSLMPFAHPSPEMNHPISLLNVDHEADTCSQREHLTTIPQPIFALSQRLLAFASSPPRPESPSHTSSRTPRAAYQADSDSGIFRLPTTQAEFGTAAVKIGGSVLSGMKALGGMAFSAARAGVSAAVSSEYGQSRTSNPTPLASGKFYSRSAPESSGHARRYSTSAISNSGSQGDATSPGPVEAKNLSSTKEHGHYITVLDLRPLHAASIMPSPTVVAEFMVSRHQPISAVQFSADGTSLVITPKDGQTMKVYKLRPTENVPQMHRRDVKTCEDTRHAEDGLYTSINDLTYSSAPWHIYDLRRGRTSAVVERLDWATDGRWLAVSSHKRTIHLFALNPYGGPTDERSHLDGKVVNISEPQPLSTPLAPVERLRLPVTHPEDRVSAPPAFTFIPATGPLPLALAPQPPLNPQSVSSSPSSAHSNTSSSARHSEIVSHQDILVFDPSEGALSLRRVILSRRTRDDVSSSLRAVSMPGASISLPGISTIGRPAAASLASPSAVRQPSGITRMMEKPTDLVAQNTVVATWALRRAMDWQIIKRSFRSRQAKRTPSRLNKPDWLSQAELSTCSRSKGVVPRSVYLAHQFSFYYLEEDYHALLRSYHFDLPANKIDVRKQVEVCATGGAMSESFVSGSSLPSQSGFSSSFDEPLASALSAELRYLNSSPPIPMYPNGPTRPSGRPAIPIRNVAAGISDGMTEGLGRLRREIGKVRSPRLAPRGGGISSSVPLEFDEEDEDFLGLDIPSVANHAISRSTSREADYISTPSTGMEPLPTEREGDVMWRGWEAEDKQAVEEVEQFDDIGVGFMDEEWIKGTGQY